MDQDSNRLPEQIYVRRRVAAVAIVLLLAALGVWAAVALGKSGDDSAAETAATTAAPATSEASAEETTTAAEEETTEAEETDAAAPTTAEIVAPDEVKNKRSCELADLQVTAATDQPTYEPDKQPHFYLTVTNPTQGDCVVDLEQQHLRFEVYDMASNKRVWADTDCNESEGRGKLEIHSHEERHFEAVWSRTSSAPQACEAREPVAPGSYYVHAVIGDNPSQALPFNLG